MTTAIGYGDAYVSTGNAHYTRVSTKSFEEAFALADPMAPERVHLPVEYKAVIHQKIIVKWSLEQLKSDDPVVKTALEVLREKAQDKTPASEIKQPGALVGNTLAALGRMINTIKELIGMSRTQHAAQTPQQPLTPEAIEEIQKELLAQLALLQSLKKAKQNAPAQTSNTQEETEKQLLAQLVLLKALEEKQRAADKAA